MTTGLNCIKLLTLVGRGACLRDEFLLSDNGVSGFPAWLCESGPSVSSFLWWQVDAEKMDGGNMKRETFPAVGEAELDRFTVCFILFRSDAFLKCFFLCTCDILELGCSPGTALAAGKENCRVSAQVTTVHAGQLYLKIYLKVGECFTPALTFKAWGEDKSGRGRGSSPIICNQTEIKILA